MKRLILFLWLALLTLLISSCLPEPSSLGQPVDTKPTEENGKPATAPPPSRLRLAVVGDIMMHNSQVRAGLQPDGTYDFRAFFREVKPYLNQADWVLGNLETTLPGPPYTNYPIFRSPEALAPALKHAGFDILSTANNHSMDAGFQGVVRTHEVLKNAGIEPVGTAPRPEMKKPLILEKNGIRLSLSAYTYGTNGIPVPQEHDYAVNRIRMDRIAKDIQTGREAGADIIAVMLHFGTEYLRTPTPEQKRIAGEVLRAGADIVLGSHPHVLQPMKHLTIDGQEKLVVYSLGNFISGQVKPHTNEGAILYLDWIKEPGGDRARLERVSYVPTYVHKYPEKGVRQFVVIPVHKEEGRYRILPYPALRREPLEQAWNNTRDTFNRYESFPVFSLPEDEMTPEKDRETD